MYTWDDPCAKRELRWEFKDGKMSSAVVDVAKVCWRHLLYQL